MEFDKVWLITGITGQDGSFLAEYLLELGYVNIHGTLRRSSSFNTERINGIFNQIKLHYADLTDFMSISNIIQKIKPDYIVNFAAQSHVKVSAELEEYTIRTNTNGFLNILNCCKGTDIRIYQASTSEMFGNTGGKLDLSSEMKPVSVYGISKLASHQLARMYRDAHGLFVVSGVLFNHESERRGGTFVTKKIVDYVRKGDFETPLQLGNIDSSRDWGYAKDYVKAVYLMLTQPEPKDYIVSTGETHTIREFVDLAFGSRNRKLIWTQTDATDAETGQILVQVNPIYFRDIDIEFLLGDNYEIQHDLGWKPETTFRELVKIMLFN